MSAAYLLPIADREALAWIVSARRTAFGEHRRRDAEALAVGDNLFLYTTRGCFRNPTRDRGRVIGKAVVTTTAARARRAPAFGGREYPLVVELEIEALAPLRQGVELAPLVSKLRATFPDSATWSVRMRRALVPLDGADAIVIEHELRGVAVEYAAALPGYEALG
jgi:hypothetical protein